MFDHFSVPPNFGVHELTGNRAASYVLPVELVRADKDLARLAGHLRGPTVSAGLSLGDRFCLALAKRKGVPAWTADKEWKRIAGAVGVEVVTIR